MSLAEGLERFPAESFSSLYRLDTWKQGAHRAMLNLAQHFFPLDKQERMLLRDAIHQQWNETEFSTIISTIEQSHDQIVESLERVGLTPDTYIQAIVSLIDGNMQALRVIVDESEVRMGREKSANRKTESQFQPVYREDWMKRHQKPIEAMIEKVPKSENPEIIILMGPPGSGKSEVFEADPTWDNNAVVNIDIDDIRKLLKKKFNPKNQKEVESLREEAWRFADNLMAQAVEAGRSVVLHTSLAREEFWLDNDFIHYAINEKRYGVRVKSILRPFYDSFRRSVLRGSTKGSEGRMVALGDFIDALNGYWVLERFTREYNALLELYDYAWLLYDQSDLVGRMDFDIFSSLLALRKKGSGVRVKYTPMSKDVKIKKNGNGHNR